MTDTGEALRLDQLSVRFGDVVAVDNASLSIAHGEAVGLVGESGSGKTAMALAVARLLPRTATISGQVLWQGTDLVTASAADLLRVRGRGIGVVFQDPHSTLNPVRTVGSQLSESVAVLTGVSRSHATRVARELLSQVGLSDLDEIVRRYPHELSGGMKQRVMIALALAGEPEMLIADEATTALDVTVQAQILDLLREIIDQRQMSLLLVTHDLGVAARVVDRIAVMYSSRIVENGPVDDVFRAPQHPYTAALLACVPSLRVDPTAPFATIEGSLPTAAQRSPGCAFAPRCPHAHARCESRPPLSARGRDRLVACWLSSLPASAPEPPEAAGHATAVAESSPPENGVVLELRDVTVRYGDRHLFRRRRARRPAVSGLDLKLGAGRTVGIVGESGCGKSSAAKAILRLVLSSGSVLVNGRDLADLDRNEMRKARRDLQLVMQDITDSINPTFTVFDAIAEPVAALSIVPAAERDQYVRQLLREVSLSEDILDVRARSLSGGQRQRLNVARALATRPSVLVADEPTSALDVSVRGQVLNLLRNVQRERGIALVFISHDLAIVRQMSDEVVVMYRGTVVERGTRDEVFDNPSHPYTQELLESLPTLDSSPTDPHRGRRPIAVLEDSTRGCAFADRCPVRYERCLVEAPRLSELGSSHSVACFRVTDPEPGGPQPSSTPRGMPSLNPSGATP